MIGLAYALVFTPWGNGIVSSQVESKINEEDLIVFKFEDFLLNTSEIKIVASVDGSSKIDIQGIYSMFEQSIDLTYNIDLEDLSKFEKFADRKLSGSLKIDGVVVGDKELLKIEGTTDIFASESTYDVQLKDFSPSYIKAKVKKANIAKALQMLNEPAYSEGNIDIDANIVDVNLGSLDGTVLVKIYNGVVNNKVVNREFDMKLVDKLSFKSAIDTKLQGNTVLIDSTVDTSKADLIAKTTKINLETSKITSDYKLVVSDLSKLFDVTNTKMRGAVTLTGAFEKDKNLLVTGSSKLLGGTLNYKLLNDDLTANLEKIDLLRGLHMMYYPEVFSSDVDVDVTYNLKQQKGLFNMRLMNGKIKENQYTRMINKFARFDLTKEAYEEATLESEIDKNIINSVMHFKSKYSTLDMTKSVFDTEKSTIDSVITVNIKGFAFDTIIEGDVASPKIRIKLDAEQALRAKLEEEKAALQAKLQAKLDAEKAELQAKLDKKKAELNAKLDAEKAELKAKVDAEKADLQNKAKDKLGEQFKKLF